MAKMRGFKPEIWTDDKFVHLTPLARLLFMGMWNYACDNGHLDDKPIQMKMRILPADDCDVAQLVEEIVQQGMATRKKGVLTIPNLPVHQRLDKRYFTTCEHCAPDEHTSGTRSAHDVRPTLTPDEGRKEGEEGDSASRESADLRKDVRTDVREDVRTIDRFDEFWDAYDKKRDRKRAEQKWRLALKKKGVTADLLIERAATYIQRQQSTGKHPEFTKDPATWLNGENWNDEVAPAETSPHAHIKSVAEIRAERGF